MRHEHSAAALSALRGEQAARNLLLKLGQGMAAPDELHEALGEILATGEEACLRSFCRVISKALERGRA